MSLLTDGYGTTEVAEIAAFLHREARLLDEHQLDEWLSLFAPDGSYWMPASWQQPDPHVHLSLYHEDVDLLTVRVRRIQHPRTETMRPAPRTLHQIGNITIDTKDQRTGELEVYSALTVIEYRLDEQRLFAAHCRHRLRRMDDVLRIVVKRVDLLNCDTERGHVRFNIPM